MNNVTRFWRVEFGGGILVFEVVKLAVFESLLPNGSSQFGPPLYFITANKLSKLVDEKKKKILKEHQFRRPLGLILVKINLFFYQGPSKDMFKQNNAKILSIYYKNLQINETMNMIGVTLTTLIKINKIKRETK